MDRMKVHFQNIQNIADTTTLPHAMVYLSARVEERMDILHLTEKLMKGKGQQNPLTSLEKLELWNRLKIQSIYAFYKFFDLFIFGHFILHSLLI